ncbi:MULTISPECIES: type II toxin-antitoxin system RelE family toxin [Sulfurospirillum]|uniref:RelE-like protein n=3 Tax=Sulfurospirillum TaxID=57665 RepID=A0A1D7THF1_9BACT|nr:MULTISPECIES: type II toxin-antitoxin system RelE/ParE family toxin [Sulfurospirillum]AHJ11908.1 RelE-like protein [Sulfurospirillum multivorans DSM 12446]AOO64417.1 RelE-like protein [Sulfurospirillum halorespirans DSM 13726]QEH05413.1 RelE-like protein [Sulfurospirillum multivorans]
MAYDIIYDPKVLKQLKKLDKEIASLILEGIESFAKSPVLTKIKKLKTPFDGAYRLRIGDYRVIFYHEENLMLISKVAHRKDVYL